MGEECTFFTQADIDAAIAAVNLDSQGEAILPTHEEWMELHNVTREALGTPVEELCIKTVSGEIIRYQDDSEAGSSSQASTAGWGSMSSYSGPGWYGEGWYTSCHSAYHVHRKKNIVGGTLTEAQVVIHNVCTTPYPAYGRATITTTPVVEYYADGGWGWYACDWVSTVATHYRGS